MNSERLPSRELQREYARLFTVLGAALLLLLAVLDVLAPGGRGFLVVTPANVDSISYFAVSHSLLFDRDLNLTNQFRVLIPETTPLNESSLRWITRNPATGLPGSPYAIGYSLLAMPWLAAGTAVDGLSGGRGDGYGRWAERFFVTANVFYLTAALILLHRFLLSLGLRWSEKERPAARWAAVAAAALVPATALGYYAFTVMSHTVSFLGVCLFLLTWWTRRDSTEWRSWIWVGAAGGLMLLCRWQDILFLSAPVTYELMRRPFLKMAGERNWWTSRIAACLAALVMLAPQMIEWKILYGSFVTIPQGPDFLTLPPPRILHVLFSSWNGLFFTTPATLAGAAGILLGLLRDRQALGPLAAAAALQVAVVGCLSAAWSGFAFAMRMLISAMPVAAAGILFLFLSYGRRTKVLTAAWICAGSVFTLLSAVQWRYEFVPRRGPLTFREAFSDKLRLTQAYRRQRAVQAVLRDAPKQDPAYTVQKLEEIQSRFGESRVLLRAIVAASERAGLDQNKLAAERRLQEISSQVLF